MNYNPKVRPARLTAILAAGLLLSGSLAGGLPQAAPAVDQSAENPELYPASREADLAAFAAATRQIAQGFDDRALVTLLELLEWRPGNPVADQARFLAADLYDRRGEPARAMQELQMLRDASPPSPLAAVALQRETLLYRLRWLAGPAAGPIPPWRFDEAYAAATLSVGLKSPRALAFSSDGALWVADEKADSLVALDASGNVATRQVWQRPVFLAADPAGSVRVAGGREVGRPGEAPHSPAAGPAGKDREPSMLRRIGGIAVAPDRRVLLIDDSDSALLRYSPSLEFESVIYRADSGSLQGLAVDRDGRIWVGLEGRKEVVLLDSSGRELRRIDSKEAEGGFASVLALATDEVGTLYLLDNRSKRIFLYDRSGKTISSIDLSSGPLAETTPSAIAVDRVGAVYIADRRGSRVLRMK